MSKFMLALIFLFFSSCSDRENNNTKQAQEDEQKTSQEIVKLELNNGEKWKIDSVTRKNIDSIKALLADTSNESEYKNLGEKLQQKIDQLIKECRMKGADHEALHHWLEIFLQDLNRFKQSDKLDKQLYISLQKDIEQFDQYFE